MQCPEAVEGIFVLQLPATDCESAEEAFTGARCEQQPVSAHPLQYCGPFWVRALHVPMEETVPVGGVNVARAVLVPLNPNWQPDRQAASW